MIQRKFSGKELASQIASFSLALLVGGIAVACGAGIGTTVVAVALTSFVRINFH